MDKDISWIIDKFFAHAGFHNAQAPVNSLASFSRAIENGYGIELDVRLLEDNTVVVFHDRELGRLTGQDGYISKLKKEDLGKFRLEGTDEHIPTLEEALNFINGRVPVLIDIKSESVSVGKFEAKILETIKNYKGQVAVMSFNPLTCEWFKKNAPELPRGLLTTKWTKDLPDRPNGFIKRFVTAHNILHKRADADFVAINVNNLPTRQLNKFKGKPILGWVVKSQEEYLKIVSYVDNIIFEGFKPSI